MRTACGRRRPCRAPRTAPPPRGVAEISRAEMALPWAGDDGAELLIGMADATQPPATADDATNITSERGNGSAAWGLDPETGRATGWMHQDGAMAARDFVLHGQAPGREMELSGYKVHFGTAGAAVHIVDIETREYRESTLADLYGQHLAVKLLKVQAKQQDRPRTAGRSRACSNRIPDCTPW